MCSLLVGPMHWLCSCAYTTSGSAILRSESQPQLDQGSGAGLSLLGARPYRSPCKARGGMMGHTSCPISNARPECASASSKASQPVPNALILDWACSLGCSAAWQKQVCDTQPTWTATTHSLSWSLSASGLSCRSKIRASVGQPSAPGLLVCPGFR